MGLIINGKGAINDSDADLHADLVTVDGKVDVVDTNVDGIVTNVGTSTQFASNKTLLGYNNSFYQHIHSPGKCYPTLASGVTITGHNTAWTLGNKTEVIPADTITNAFDLHFVNIEAASATDAYEIVVYGGTVGNEVEIGRVRAHKNSVQSGANNVPIQVAPQAANTRISVAIASSSGGGGTLTVSFFYHEYI